MTHVFDDEAPDYMEEPFDNWDKLTEEEQERALRELAERYWRAIER